MVGTHNYFQFQLSLNQAMEDTNVSRNSYDMEQLAAHAEQMANAGAERYHPMTKTTTTTSSSIPPPTSVPMPSTSMPSIAAATTTTGAASKATPHDSFEVYNPVDDSFAAWQEDEHNASFQQQQQQRQSGSDGGGGIGDDEDNDTSFFTVKKLPPENSMDKSSSNIPSDDNNNNNNYNHKDQDTTRDTLGRLVEENNRNNTDYYNDTTNHRHDTTTTTTTTTPLDDDALARAVAEQDLPPGVSAIEQQEIMMRLLTQQLRRGNTNGNGGGDGRSSSNNEETTFSPALEQRMRDFQFAQRKRRETYGNERPWGILGLYDHLGEWFLKKCVVCCALGYHVAFIVVVVVVVVVCLHYLSMLYYVRPPFYDLVPNFSFYLLPFTRICIISSNSGDTVRCRMGRRRRLATYAQGTLPQLVGLSTDTRCGLEPSLLYVHLAVCMHGSIGSELWIEWMASGAAEYQPNDWTECGDANSYGGQVHSTHCQSRRVVSTIQSDGIACRINPLLSKHGSIVVHWEGSGAMSRNCGCGNSIHHPRCRRDHIECNLLTRIYYRRSIGWNIWTDWGMYCGYLYQLVIIVQ